MTDDAPKSPLTLLRDALNEARDALVDATISTCNDYDAHVGRINTALALTADASDPAPDGVVLNMPDLAEKTAETRMDTHSEGGAQSARTAPVVATPAVEGWQWVPKHPDQFMINAFINEYHRKGGTESGCYRAMLAVAPAAPTQVEPAPTMDQMIALMREAKNIAPNLTTVDPIALTPIQVAWIVGKVRAAPAAPIEEGKASKSMLDFVDSVIEVAFEGGNLDGGEIQDMAAHHGLLKEQTMREPCAEGDQCRCAENDDFPLTCYRKTYNLAAEQAKPEPVERATVLHGVDLAVIARSYDWTIDQHGELLGVTAGDMGYEATGIRLSGDTLDIWNDGVSKIVRGQQSGAVDWESGK